MKFRIKFGILVLGLLAMSQLAIAAAIQPISVAFPSVPIATIQMLGSVPSIGGIIAALLIGPLSIHISNKFLGIGGALFITLGGLMPLLSHSNIYFLLLCVFLLGIGQSFVTTMVPTLLSEHFEGDEKQKLIGIYQAMSSLGALFLSSVSGILVAKYWGDVYYLYFLALVVFILSSIFIPNDKPSGKRNNESDSVKLKLPSFVYGLTLSSLVITLVYTAFANNVGIYIANENLGSPAITGLVIAVGTIGGLITGFSMGLIFKHINIHILSLSSLALGLSFILIFFIHSMPTLFIASFIGGAGMAMYQARAAFLMSNQAAPVLIPKSMAYLTFGNSLGGFISPLLFKFLGFSAGNSSFGIAGALATFLGILFLFSKFEKKITVSTI